MSGFVFFQVFRWIQQRAPQRTNKENGIICRLVRVSLSLFLFFFFTASYVTYITDTLRDYRYERRGVQTEIDRFISPRRSNLPVPSRRCCHGSIDFRINALANNRNKRRLFRSFVYGEVKLLLNIFRRLIMQPCAGTLFPVGERENLGLLELSGAFGCLPPRRFHNASRISERSYSIINANV